LETRLQPELNTNGSTVDWLVIGKGPAWEYCISLSLNRGLADREKYLVECNACISSRPLRDNNSSPSGWWLRMAFNITEGSRLFRRQGLDKEKYVIPTSRMSSVPSGGRGRGRGGRRASYLLLCSNLVRLRSGLSNKNLVKSSASDASRSAQTFRLADLNRLWSSREPKSGACGGKNGREGIRKMHSNATTPNIFNQILLRKDIANVKQQTRKPQL